ncbi:MAG: hypothetical protein KBC91_02925, partial [Candidatus Omnitrophica bacterium]|nr:hypothetical protein [Candidatus Omnitrophota bacterium]
MKTRIGLLGLLLIAALPRFVYAEDAQASASITAAPLRYVFVQGDENKFREHHWIQDDYGGGIEEFSLEEKNIPTDFSVSVDGHVNPADNDYSTLIHAEKTDLAYLDFDYEEFSKFYDNSGGVYYPFKNLSSIALDRELELEIGRIHVEAGLLIPDKPRLTVAYDRHYKQGSKSRLTWGAVKEGSITRSIAPSFQEIDEMVDSVELTQSHTIKETEIKGRQYWEWMSTKSMREEQNFATTGVAADNKIRDQYQKPESHVF